jgi:hypothetical protein
MFAEDVAATHRTFVSEQPAPRTVGQPREVLVLDHQHAHQAARNKALREVTRNAVARTPVHPQLFRRAQTGTSHQSHPAATMPRARRRKQTESTGVLARLATRRAALTASSNAHQPEELPAGTDIGGRPPEGAARRRSRPALQARDQQPWRWRSRLKSGSRNARPVPRSRERLGTRGRSGDAQRRAAGARAFPSLSHFADWRASRGSSRRAPAAPLSIDRQTATGTHLEP